MEPDNRSRIHLRTRACRRVPGFVLAMAVLAGAAGAQAPWTDAEKERLLLNAEILGEKTLRIGSTGSKRVTLSDGSRTHDAHVQTVDVIRHEWHSVGDLKRPTFKDSYRYNIAAYRLDRLLDLHMVPVSVERRLGGRPAAVTWWVDDVAMMERDRIRQRLSAPDPQDWFAQKQRTWVFNQLIANTDLNQGNILITGDWQIRLVDFTRAFRTIKLLLEPDRLIRIDVSLLSRLRNLGREQVEGRLGDCLTRGEIRTLLIRRDKIVELFDLKLARRHS